MTNAWAQKVATRVRWQYPLIYAMVVLEEKHRTAQEARARRRNNTKWANDSRASLRRVAREKNHGR